ncbi:MAG: hypothetical protein Q4F70_00190 [Clostridia bacterium]|nr:hypothetical protein [Clostridia bacterium]
MGLFSSSIALWDDKSQRLDLDMTKEDLYSTLKLLDALFFKARLVDVENSIEYNVTPEGKIVPTETCCFAVWGKDSPCTNCTSMQAFKSKSQLTKHESIGSVQFHILSKYIEFNHKPYVLEVVIKETHNVMS